MNRHPAVIEDLLHSSEAIIRLNTLVKLEDSKENASQVEREKLLVPNSTLIMTLLSEQNNEGIIPHHPYNKWRGAHWVLACLADIGYPPGDQKLLPLFEQVYSWLFSTHHLGQIKSIEGRVRRCASIEGNALFASIMMGFLDDRSHRLAQSLLQWQWSDGGWNCDKRPQADSSSFMETLIPMRALAHYSKITDDATINNEVHAAAEVFLKRRLFQRISDGKIINQDFVKLHYPCYWHYDILFALKVMAEIGIISDSRCQHALDILEAKEYPTGGFALEAIYFKTSEKATTSRSLVNWKAYTLNSHSKCNQFVTLDALYVLKHAGRIKW